MAAEPETDGWSGRAKPVSGLADDQADYLNQPYWLSNQWDPIQRTGATIEALIEKNQR